MHSFTGGADGGFSQEDDNLILDQFGDLYGTTAKSMMCLEFTTGKIQWEENSLGAASICYADGHLYLHGENGEVALVEASSRQYREKGRFTPPDQPKHTNPMEKAWAYPVVANGRLYIRDHNALWCYDVKPSDTRHASRFWSYSCSLIWILLRGF